MITYLQGSAGHICFQNLPDMVSSLDGVETDDLVEMGLLKFGCREAE
jgi:hypothetical protein